MNKFRGDYFLRVCSSISRKGVSDKGAVPGTVEASSNVREAMKRYRCETCERIRVCGEQDIHIWRDLAGRRVCWVRAIVIRLSLPIRKRWCGLLNGLITIRIRLQLVCQISRGCPQ